MVVPKDHQLITFYPSNGKPTNTAGLEKSTRLEADGKDAAPRNSLKTKEQLFEGDLGQSDDVLTLSTEVDLLKSPVSGQDKESKAPSRDNQHKRQKNKKRHTKSKAGF